jgi:hypothetical protein
MAAGLETTNNRPSCVRRVQGGRGSDHLAQTGPHNRNQRCELYSCSGASELSGWPGQALEMLHEVLHPRRAAAGQGRPFQTARVRPCVRSRAATVEVPAAETPTTSSADAEPLRWRAQLDFKFVKENVDLVAENCRRRFSSADAHRVVALYDEFVALKAQADGLRAERNENSNAMKARLGWQGAMQGSPSASLPAACARWRRCCAPCPRDPARASTLAACRIAPLQDPT